MFEPGDVVTIDFPGVTGIKRRPAVILSSSVYHQIRPDIIVGLITSQTRGAVSITDYLIEDWAAAGLRVSSAFRSFLTTLPPAAKPVKIGDLSLKDWAAVCLRVKTALVDLT